MTIRRILLLLLCLIVIVGMVEAKSGQKAKTQAVVTPYKIWKTNTVPVIDGKMDKIWCAIPWIPLTKYTTGGTAIPDSEDNACLTKAMWDANNLYILMYTEAPNICDVDPGNNWNTTANEIFISATDSKTTPYLATDYCFQIPHLLQGTETAVGVPTRIFGGKIDSTGCEFKISTDVSTTADSTAGLGGWFLELKLPLANLSIPAVAGTILGWDYQSDIVEDPTATTRQYAATWWDTDNNNWKETDTFGEAILSADVNIGMAKIYGGTATIDGVEDAAYTAKPGFQNADYFRFVDGTSDDIPNPTAGNVVCTSIYDATNLYMFFDVNDNNITDIPTNPLWNQSAVEWYIGPDDKVSPYGPLDQQYQIPNWMKGQETGKLTTIYGGKLADTAGAAFKVVDKADASGYTVELNIPWTALNLGLPIDSGTVIGYLFQMDYSSSGTARTGCAQWWDNTNGNWNSSITWGEAMLQKPGTAVKQLPTVVNRFNLDQNYPNPFNPATQIQYTIDKASKVKLTVYNVLGNQVAVLVNQTQQAGTYQTTFDAKNFSSGVYFYKLEAGSKTMSKKMMLLK